MVLYRPALVITVIVAGLLFLTGSAAASPGIRTALGDEVTIAGYSTAGPYVYLFLTGPNLPENGVALHDISKRADQGWFTKVSVDGDDHWTYTWHTGSMGGRLDEGTYTIWVVDGPNDRSRLAWADYQTISVTLTKPFVSVDMPVQPGAMDLQSVPEGATLLINGEYRGETPLRISDLSPGNYAVTFSRFGFIELSTSVPVEGGKITEVAVTLRPDTGTLMVNSTPTGARVLLDGVDSGLSPLVIPNLSAEDHTVTLEKDGYIPAAQKVSITAGQMNPVDVSLQPVPVVTSTKARAAGLDLAMTGTFIIILFGAVYRGRRNR
jgi:PEGA domain